MNKARVQRLQAAGLLAPAGLAAIELARQNGSWALLDEVEALTVPPDLTAALAAQPEAQTYFESLPKSTKKMLLQHLVLARRPETRQRRVAEIVELAAQRQVPAFVRPAGGARFVAPSAEAALGELLPGCG